MAFFAIAAIIILTSGSSQAEGPPTFHTRFERTVTTVDSEEVVRGTIYFQGPAKAMLVIDHPLNQYMIIEDQELTLYYPDSQEAFRFAGDQPVVVPFVEAIIRSLKEGYGLIELGFQMADYEKKGDHLFSSWRPSAAAQKNAPEEIVLEILSEKIVSAEVRTLDGKTVARTTFGNHIQFEGKQIPLEVTSALIDGGEPLQKEHIAYQDLQFDVELPDWIANFQIPASVCIKASH